jgi:hypothetical protein
LTDIAPADIVADAGIMPPVSIDVTLEPHAILNITDAINADAIPQTYVRNGRLVTISEVSGDVLADQPHAVPLRVAEITADGLRRLLARHTDTHKIVRKKDRKTGEEQIGTVPVSPAVSTAKAVLSETHWPKVRPLLNVVHAPVFRPDGTILQDPGYDEATRLYYAPIRNVPRVPDVPDVVDVDKARRFLLNYVLGDMPWADGASCANFVGLLMTPMLRPFIKGLSPLGAIDARAPGSGKTLLTDIVGHLYGATSRSWVSDDGELRKAITATLQGTSEPVVVLDNVGERDQVDQPTLAKLLTGATWNDRELGSSRQVDALNDRLWLVTGNNISFGGDIPSRTVLVSLDPKVPDPDKRSGFRIPDLNTWLEDEANQVELLYHLLVLARAWVVAGAPTADRTMRNFRRWARAMAGFTQYHEIPGFMTNTDALAGHDEEGAIWSAFLAAWHDEFNDTPKRASELLKTSELQPTSSGFHDPWDGAFLTRADGGRLTSKGLGAMLKSKMGRFFGEYVIRGIYDKKKKVWRFHVDRVERREAAVDGGEGGAHDRA